MHWRQTFATEPTIILAKDAEIGKEYLMSGLGKRVKILKIHGDPDAGYVSSVYVEIDGEKTNISGSTELEPAPEKSRVKDTPILQEPEAPRIRMGDIIIPMLLEGTHTAEEIADAVLEKNPELIPKDAPDREWRYKKLIQQIKGPRMYNLMKDIIRNKGKMPKLLPSRKAGWRLAFEAKQLYTVEPTSDVSQFGWQLLMNGWPEAQFKDEVLAKRVAAFLNEHPEVL